MQLDVLHLVALRGHSKSTFAQDSLTHCSHLLVLARTHPLPLNFYTCEIYRIIMSTSIFG